MIDHGEWNTAVQRAIENEHEVQHLVKIRLPSVEFRGYPMSDALRYSQELRSVHTSIYQKNHSRTTLAIMYGRREGWQHQFSLVWSLRRFPAYWTHNDIGLMLQRMNRGGYRKVSM